MTAPARATELPTEDEAVAAFAAFERAHHTSNETDESREAVEVLTALQARVMSVAAALLRPVDRENARVLKYAVGVVAESYGPALLLTYGATGGRLEVSAAVAEALHRVLVFNSLFWTVLLGQPNEAAPTLVPLFRWLLRHVVHVLRGQNLFLRTS